MILVASEKRMGPVLCCHTYILLRHKSGSDKFMYFYPVFNNNSQKTGWNPMTPLFFYMEYKCNYSSNLVRFGEEI